MLRRKPARERLGDASFGRRIPRINTVEIRAEVEATKKITTFEIHAKTTNKPKTEKERSPL